MTVVKAEERLERVAVVTHALARRFVAFVETGADELVARQWEGGELARPAMSDLGRAPAGAR